MNKEILVIDDNPDIRYLICNILKEKNFSVRSAANYDQAVLEINKKIPDLAIIDIKLDRADKDGIDLLKILIKKNNSIPIIMISGHATVQIALESIRLGAYEFIEKGASFSTDKLLNYVYRALETANLKEEKDIIENKLFHSFELIGRSPSIIKVKKIIEKLSNAESRVLISGPTGSGKELVARKIHKLSLRNKKPFVVINAASLKEKTYERELFGQEFGDGTISFGVLDRANKGTLLIDEVTEIPIETQANILRVLIDQKFKRINSNHDIKVNVRIICTSSKNINNETQLGNFREDLFHRLNVFQINIEPLSNRVSDIPLLIEYFSKTISKSYNIKDLNIDKEDSYLLNHFWPGNVRELRNLIERIAILSNNDQNKIKKIIKETIKQGGIETLKSNNLSVPLKEARENFEKEYLTTQLKKFGGNISKTAKFVGMERSALHRKLKGLGVKDLN